MFVEGEEQFNLDEFIKEIINIQSKAENNESSFDFNQEDINLDKEIIKNEPDIDDAGVCKHVLILVEIIGHQDINLNLREEYKQEDEDVNVEININDEAFIQETEDGTSFNKKDYEKRKISVNTMGDIFNEEIKKDVNKDDNFDFVKCEKNKNILKTDKNIRTEDTLIEYENLKGQVDSEKDTKNYCLRLKDAKSYENRLPPHLTEIVFINM